MGDRCYMRVTCRAADKKRFEDLNFAEDESAREGELVDMVDEEANYAHSGNMPLDIPYFGFNGAGGDYGPAEFCCDGETYCEQPKFEDGGLCIAVNDLGEINQDDLAVIRHYIDLKAAVKKMLGVDPGTEPAAPSTKTTVVLDDREHATVLAALRYYQRKMDDPSVMGEIGCTATNGGNVIPLTAEEVDALCERINCA